MCMLQIPCELDDRLAGLVEAWASGVTWQELLGCKLDEGDLARLLRRTIDLLAQVITSCVIFSMTYSIHHVLFSVFSMILRELTHVIGTIITKYGPFASKDSYVSCRCYG